jgi:CheY-like chemotaxis protein
MCLLPPVMRKTTFQCANQDHGGGGNSVKGKILHLEDDPEWIEHVRALLGEKYDLHSVTNLEEAAQRVIEVYRAGDRIDLAICDINLTGARSVQLHRAAESARIGISGPVPPLFEPISGAGEDIDVIVLSGYLEIDQNMRKAFRDYRVLDVFDKGDFADEAEQFAELIAMAVARNREDVEA